MAWLGRAGPVVPWGVAVLRAWVGGGVCTEAAGWVARGEGVDRGRVLWPVGVVGGGAVPCWQWLTPGL